MKTGYYLLLALTLALLIKCKSTLPITLAKEAGTITTGSGPEDFVLDTFNQQNRFIISCTARRDSETKIGNFEQYDFKKNHSKVLKRYNEPKDFKCFPHGIDLVQKKDGTVLLFVVNHQPISKKKTIHSVVEYKLNNDSLIFIANHISSLIVSPNDVCALNDGSFYVTNDAKHTKGFGLLWEKVFQTKSSTIIYKNANNNFIVAANNLPYANGIATKDNQVYVSCTFKSILNGYSMNTDGTLKINRKIAGVKGMDNITFYKNYLVIPSHPSFTKFIKHLKTTENKSPGIITLFDIRDNNSKTIYATDGKSVSANSTAIIYNDTLYIGQVFDNFLLKVVNFE